MYDSLDEFLEASSDPGFNEKEEFLFELIKWVIIQLIKEGYIK